ncbi:hypothetical protein BV22DRAFT_247569 [Leucogyrophana mollusca]|uniref:Uncharacterized protein n=1 Tax=Leucogyrophana mollusca TaxID=85980 RepID=A0ACB8BPP9_9AGAM|nr:hypothetical protein BV22DRAFT_247569 [Leucogyrophana mollusca]
MTMSLSFFAWTLRPWVCHQDGMPPESATKTLGPGRVFVRDPETASVDSTSMWGDKAGITALRNITHSGMRLKILSQRVRGSGSTPRSLYSRCNVSIRLVV